MIVLNNNFEYNFANFHKQNELLKKNHLLGQETFLDAETFRDAKEDVSNFLSGARVPEIDYLDFHDTLVLVLKHTVSEEEGNSHQEAFKGDVRNSFLALYDATPTATWSSKQIQIIEDLQNSPDSMDTPFAAGRSSDTDKDSYVHPTHKSLIEVKIGFALMSCETFLEASTFGKHRKNADSFFQGTLRPLDLPRTFLETLTAVLNHTELSEGSVVTNENEFKRVVRERFLSLHESNKAELQRTDSASPRKSCVTLWQMLFINSISDISNYNLFKCSKKL